MFRKYYVYDLDLSTGLAVLVIEATELIVAALTATHRVSPELGIAILVLLTMLGSLVLQTRLTKYDERELPSYLSA